jgi:Steigviridae/Suoliviridae L,D-carboxypeptidase/transpeptidase
VNLILKRHAPSLTCTIGELFEDDVFVCFTLEDLVREIKGRPVEEWKVRGETAIPEGVYKITVTHSKHFDRDLPLLNAVPGFLGVRIHSGNTDADTDGCILVGTKVAENGESLLESRDAFDELFEIIRDAIDVGEEVWITVGSQPSETT